MSCWQKEIHNSQLLSELTQCHTAPFSQHGSAVLLLLSSAQSGAVDHVHVQLHRQAAVCLPQRCAPLPHTHNRGGGQVASVDDSAQTDSVCSAAARGVHYCGRPAPCRRRRRCGSTTWPHSQQHSASRESILQPQHAARTTRCCCCCIIMPCPSWPPRQPGTAARRQRSSQHRRSRGYQTPTVCRCGCWPGTCHSL